MPPPDPIAATLATPPRVPAVKKPTDEDLAASIPLGPPQKAGELGTLGPYRIVRIIGRGGMGMVFLGVDPKLRRKVAIKVMLPKFLAKPASRERFFREARAVAAVKNDHIVTIYAVDEANGVPYLALEYLHGCTLEQFLRSGHALTMPQRVHIARQVAVGLAAAHEHNVIHRDIKPENIWLEAPEGRVKLIDFGLARVPQASNATVEGTVMGTPAYMSPEQAKGVESEPRSDLFSLGAVLYRLLAGRIPFKGDTPLATVLALTNDPHVPLPTLNPTVPPALAVFVDRLLSKVPEGRPATAKDAAKELKRIEALLRHADAAPTSDAGTQNHPATVIPISVQNENTPWAGLETESPSGTPSQSTRIVSTKRKDSGPLVWVGVAIFLAVVALVVGLVSQGGKAPTVAAPVEPKRTPMIPAKPAPPVFKPDPFTPLFNGKELSGWAVPYGGPGRWSVPEPNVLRGDEAGGDGLLLIHDRTVSRFELRLDYRWMQHGGDAGVLLYASETGGKGIEIQLADDSDPKAISGLRRLLGNPATLRHGAILGFKAPSNLNVRAHGDWNTLKIIATGTRITVDENGQVINEYDYPQQADRKSFRERQPGLAVGSGRVGLQILQGSAEFRNIRLKEMP
jgi:serine/threonine protein kinase